MTSEHNLTVAEAAVREALTQNRFEDAARLLPAYTQAAADLHTPAAAAQALTLIKWARKLALARRTAMAAELASLLGRPRYGGNQPTLAASTWEIRG